MATTTKLRRNRGGVAISQRVDRTIDPTAHHAVDDAPGLAIFRAFCKFVTDRSTRMARVHRLDSQLTNGHRVNVSHRTLDLDAVGSDDRSTLFGQALDWPFREFVPVVETPRIGADCSVDFFGIR